MSEASSSSTGPTAPTRPLHELQSSTMDTAIAFRTPSHRSRKSILDSESYRNETIDSAERTRRSTGPGASFRQSRMMGSPFLSPPIQHSADPSSRTRKVRPEPLVLDPSASHRMNSLAYRSMTADSSPASKVSVRDGGGHPTGSTVQHLLQVATQGIRDHHAAAAHYSSVDSIHATPAAGKRHAHNSTAANFARSSGVARAGFLQKLGKNIPEFKRRFFVLKPETNLYYYLSPNEREPRGRIDLEGSSIEVLEKTLDGRFRFAISLRNEDDEREATQGGTANVSNGRHLQQIVLEARSAEIGEEWIKHMKTERVSFLKDQVESLEIAKVEQANEIADLQKQIEEFKMIEADRDGALEDAKNWKHKFQRLDEGLRMLTQQIRKSLTSPISTDPKGKALESKDRGNPAPHQEGANETTREDKSDKIADDGVERKLNDDKSYQSEKDGVDIGEVKPTETKETQTHGSNALLDDLVQEDMEVEEIIDVPGTYFSGLANAFQQQKEASRLASIEASTAVEDLLEANERVDTIQKRMKKAEKQILKLWEENCTIRKTLKQKKREKRVLVREVKELQQTVHDLRENNQQLSQSILVGATKKVPEEDGPMADTMIGSDEERLIIELEEHVASSIRLHERLVAGTDFDRDMEQSKSTTPASVPYDAIFGRGNIETSKPKLLSLLDDDEGTDTDSEEEINFAQNGLKHQDSRSDLQSFVGSIASTVDNTTASDGNYTQYAGNTESFNPISPADESASERRNPLLQLDDDGEESNSKRNSHSLKPSSSKHITENGQATSRLVCPLADVVDTNGKSHAVQNDLKVHHLTFYSKKIGLQFQKASPAPAKPRGLLTDAITADMAESVDGSNKAGTELRNIVSIPSMAKGETNAKGQQVKCPLALPEDIVLVCGFEGFDDSGSNQRPKLGARLVAFDGVSVEVGKWTFETISKAIKSRGRPLTLSFRNDYLTTEQRAILTQAIKDVDAKREPLPKSTLPQYERPPSTTPSLSSAFSHESGHFLNNDGQEPGRCHTRFNRSTGMVDAQFNSAEGEKYWNPVPSSNSSISSHFNESNAGRLPPAILTSASTTSISTHKSRNTVPGIGPTIVDYHSSSERQQRSSIFRTNSHSNHERNGGSERSTRRFGAGINPSGIRQHQDFQSNLL